MAKISANYEVVYILDPAQGEEAIAANVAKFQALAEQHGCSDVVVDEWGKRRLAYAIDYKTEGYYVLMSFTSAPEFPKELDRILGITEGVMRSKDSGNTLWHSINSLFIRNISVSFKVIVIHIAR